ncbi:MFS transporter [Saccharopolyspora indica]|uniref:MFS transporter n=1 Tax=Saccharopolyspora indica TaxID=1229659 RepID=UPI0022EAB774|nr:MFS transporter [Saccharopolyspora indica]MDA3648199.1 MFS transporter [Saccharopolyspora indica]
MTTTAEPAARVPLRVAVLALGTFAVGTDAFVVAGVLPEIAADLDVGIAQAGQLVTVFAIAYAVLSPVLATLTGTWPRRAVLLTALAVFVLGNIATALAPSYATVLATRVLAAAGASMFTPIAGAAAASLAPETQRARAISLVVLGLTVSTALGVPLGTLLGSVTSWRGTMWFVAALGAAAGIGVAALLPAIPAPRAASLRERLAPLRDGKITMTLLTTVAFFIGIFIVNTYISAIVEPATGGNSALLAMLLFLSGAAGTAGNLISGGWTDRFGAHRVIAVAIAVALVNCLLLPITAEALVSAVPAVLLFGLTAWSVTVPQQHRLIEAAPSSTSLVISLNASGGYLGSSLAGVIGAAALELSPASLPLVAAVFIVIGLAASELAQRIGAHS